MPPISGQRPSTGFPDGDFSGTSPDLNDLMDRGRVDEIVREAAAAPPTRATLPPAECIKEIDFGDGKGKQVFKGATWEEVADKLATAQLHASRRIRELSMNRPQEPERKPLFQPVEYKPRDLTNAEALRISEQIANGDARALDAWAQARFGVDPVQLSNGMNLVQRLWLDSLEQKAAASWARGHNGEYWQEVNLVGTLTQISQKLMAAGYPITEGNMEWAYSQLVAADEIMVEEPREEPPPAAPPATPPANDIRRTPAPTFVVSDRSGQRTEAPQSRQPGVDVAELNRMSLDQMRTAIDARLKGST